MLSCFLAAYQYECRIDTARRGRHAPRLCGDCRTRTLLPGNIRRRTGQSLAPVSDDLFALSLNEFSRESCHSRENVVRCCCYRRHLLVLPYVTMIMMMVVVDLLCYGVVWPDGAL